MANKLISEQSPYLLQHAHNPVNWYPWGNEAFEEAAKAHKPVIVSIGYAACHWCHVMEHESFEDEEVAAYMNEHFVCIKVDREEHPDVDHMYMDAVQAIGGSGGWPLNVFVTPAREPFYGGTYYPPRPAYSRPSWMQLLQRMTTIWSEQQDEVQLQAQQMIQHLQQASRKVTSAVDKEINNDSCRKIADSMLKQADMEKGGFGNAPKFPGTMAISFLLEHYHFTGYEPALQQAVRSLDAMIAGGIYDQLGGGFARYATDRNWLIPHFEKMLYDNALLVATLADAYRITGKERYRQVIEETIAFVERELGDESGGYWCALDADSEGVEGKFYTWTWEEWAAVADDTDGVAAQHFGVTMEGNWEGTNILHVAVDIATVAAERNMDIATVEQCICDVKGRLMAARSARIRPQTDDKTLLSWNALMNTALSKAAVALADDRYMTRAITHMEWMLKTYLRGNSMLHTWKQEVARIPAKLDDHAWLVQALLQLATTTGDEAWVIKASALTQTIVADFGSEDGYFYYTAAGQEDIPVRKIDLYDGATPSANAVMAQNLWWCGLCMENSAWTERSWKMLAGMANTAERYGYSFGYWALLMQRYAAGPRTMICTGSNALQLRPEIQAKYMPHSFLLISQKQISDLPILQKKFFGDKMYIFVCSEKACLSPVSSIGEAFSLMV